MCDKFKTCQNCPDRSIHPNCHTTCEGYLYRKARYAERSRATYHASMKRAIAYSGYYRPAYNRRSISKYSLSAYHSEENLKRSRS
jgi:hypothetical protein